MVSFSFRKILKGRYNKINKYSWQSTVINGVPNALGWIPSIEDIKFLAEFGIVFLMFTIGLEFSLPKLKMLKGIVFGLGFGQVAVTTAVFGFIALWL